MPIERDDKDWTWVLDRPCRECGFDAGSIDPRDVGPRLRAELPLWRGALSRSTADVRPDDATWSPVEYGCHVADVAVLYAYRLDLMLAQDDPLFANWSSDDAAEANGYGEREPAAVLQDLVRDVEILAGAFDAVPDDAWQRPGRRSDGALFTIDSFARYLLHDVVHHGWDVQRPRDPEGRF